MNKEYFKNEFDRFFSGYGSSYLFRSGDIHNNISIYEDEEWYSNKRDNKIISIDDYKDNFRKSFLNHIAKVVYNEYRYYNQYNKEDIDFDDADSYSSSLGVALFEYYSKYDISNSSKSGFRRNIIDNMDIEISDEEYVNEFMIFPSITMCRIVKPYSVIKYHVTAEVYNTFFTSEDDDPISITVNLEFEEELKDKNIDEIFDKNLIINEIFKYVSENYDEKYDAIVGEPEITITSYIFCVCKKGIIKFMEDFTGKYTPYNRPSVIKDGEFIIAGSPFDNNNYFKYTLTSKLSIQLLRLMYIIIIFHKEDINFKLKDYEEFDMVCKEEEKIFNIFVNYIKKNQGHERWNFHEKFYKKKEYLWDYLDTEKFENVLEFIKHWKFKESFIEEKFINETKKIYEKKFNKSL